MLLSTFYKESSDGMRAEVHRTTNGYSVKYYSFDGSLINEQQYNGTSLFMVESAAEDWALGVKNLNG